MARRKPVPCALCGEETRDQDKVCGICRRDVKNGRNLRQQAKDSEAEVVEIAHYWQLYPWAGRRSADSARQIKNAAMKLANPVETNLYPSTSLNNWEEVIGLTRYSMLSEGRTKYLLSPEKQIALRELIQAVCDHAAYYEWKGRYEGESFLFRLANNEISFNDLIAKDIKQSE